MTEIYVFECVEQYGGGICFVEAGNEEEAWENRMRYPWDHRDSFDLLGTLDEFVDGVKSGELKKKYLKRA